MNRTTLLRILFWLTIATCAVIAVRGHSQDLDGSESAHSRLVGVWRANTDGLPAVTMVIADEGGRLTGAIMFYLHKRETAEKPYTSTPGLPEPMLNLKVNGETLTFQVSHRRAHPLLTLKDPPVTIQLRLNGKDSASLVRGENAKRWRDRYRPRHGS